VSEIAGAQTNDAVPVFTKFSAHARATAQQRLLR
jgi:hypothetical protein